MGGFVPPYGRQSVIGGGGGGTHEEGHTPYEKGPNFERSYHKLKVLLLLMNPTLVISTVVAF